MSWTHLTLYIYTNISHVYFEDIKHGHEKSINLSDTYAINSARTKVFAFLR